MRESGLEGGRRDEGLDPGVDVGAVVGDGPCEPEHCCCVVCCWATPAAMTSGSSSSSALRVVLSADKCHEVQATY